MITALDLLAKDRAIVTICDGTLHVNELSLPAPGPDYGPMLGRVRATKYAVTAGADHVIRIPAIDVPVSDQDLVTTILDDDLDNPVVSDTFAWLPNECLAESLVACGYKKGVVVVIAPVDLAFPEDMVEAAEGADQTEYEKLLKAKPKTATLAVKRVVKPVGFASVRSGRALFPPRQSGSPRIGDQAASLAFDAYFRNGPGRAAATTIIGSGDSGKSYLGRCLEKAGWTVIRSQEPEAADPQMTMGSLHDTLTQILRCPSDRIYVDSMRAALPLLPGRTDKGGISRGGMSFFTLMETLAAVKRAAIIYVVNPQSNDQNVIGSVVDYGVGSGSGVLYLTAATKVGNMARFSVGTASLRGISRGTGDFTFELESI